MNTLRARIVVALVSAMAGVPTPAAAATPAASAASNPGRHAAPRAAVPAADFFVEWRLRPSAAGPGQAAVFSSRSAATGGSAFGLGAVVVGTAQAAGEAGNPGLRVANGQEGRLVLDRAETRTIYDLTWIASDESSDTHGSMQSDRSNRPGGTASHDRIVHHVQALRVVPRWTHGDTLPMDIEIVRTAQAEDDRAVDLETSLQLRLGEWTPVARLGVGDDEFQVRVTWR